MTPFCEHVSLFLPQGVLWFPFLLCKHPIVLTWLIGRMRIKLASQDQTKGMFSSSIWRKLCNLCGIQLCQDRAGDLLWGNPISWVAACIETKGLLCFIAKSKCRSQEQLQWLRILLPAAQISSEFYPWLKSLHVWTQLAFLPPHATFTHPLEIQTTRFAGTSSF